MSRMTAEDRKGMCLKCHDVADAHKWLPQKQLHFNYLECASCHDLNAEIGMVFSIVEKGKPSGENALGYGRLAQFIEEGKQGLVETLDQDGNGRLSPAEVRSFITKLRQKGIPEASLDVRILVLRPMHNFTNRGEQTRDCSLCHSENAKFYSKIVLEIPEKEGESRTIPVERQILAGQDRAPLMGDFYLLGESKIRRTDLDELVEIVKRIGFKWIDLLGMFVVGFCAVLVLLHAATMFLTRNLRASDSSEMAETRPVAEFVWHLVHGFFVIMLVLTGIQLRLPDIAPIFATFLNAVNLHSISGAVVIVDYLAWMVYTVWRGELRSRFFISPPGFLRHAAQVFRYYGYQIFLGERYPRSFGPPTALSPLERLVGDTVMFALLPGQILTGILLFDVHRMMPIIEKLGGLRSIDAIHLILAYLLVSFMIVHTYFHTLKKYQ